MTATALLWLVGMFVCGVALVLWGVRGKRLNDHPICRDCGFDLSAAREGCITCPECGAGLRRPKGVRIGQRRKRYVAIGAGAVAAFLPAATVGVVVFAVVTGTDLNAYKPVGLLLWEGRGRDAARAEAAVNELLARMQGSELAEAQRRAAVAAAFEAQADTARPWCAAWGDVLDRARLDDLLDEREVARYRNGAAVLEFKARPKVRAGDHLPVVVRLKEARVGGSVMLMAGAMLADARMDGEKLKRPKPATLASWIWGAEAPEPNLHVGWYYIGGPRSQWQGRSYGEARMVFAIPKDAAPGVRTVEIELQVRTEPQATGTFQWPSTLEPEHPHVRSHRGKMVVEVLPADGAGVELVEPTPELRAELERLLRPQATHAYVYDNGMAAVAGGSQQFSVKDLPVPVAFDVVWRAGDREYPMGILTSGSSADERAPYTYDWAGQEWSRTIACTPPLEFKDKRIDVVLRPNPGVAGRTLDVFEMYNGELVFEDVEVTWSDQTGRSGGGSRNWLRSLLWR